MGKRLKVVKNSIIRQLSLWICFFYIINLIHQPLSDVLHSLTHNVTAPYFVAGHQSSDTHEYKIHSPHAHEGTDTVHNHSILNTISTIFEAFNNHDNETDSLIGALLLDKHFLAEKLSFVLLIIPLKSNPLGGFKIELLRGHWLTFLRPPIPMPS